MWMDLPSKQQEDVEASGITLVDGATYVVVVWSIKNNIDQVASHEIE